MANKKYSRKTSEDRLKEIQSLSEDAMSKIEKYSASVDEMVEYANFMTKFYDYSLRNNALIQGQFPGAEAVASFKYWKDAGYTVNKGEKGIQILSFTPITRFKTADGKVKQLKDATNEEKEKIKNGQIQTYKSKAFSKGHVFDISQTNAPIEDLPKIFPNRQYNFELEEGSNKEHLKKGIQALAADVGIEIKDMKESALGYTELGSAKGAFVENPITGQKEILLNSRNTETQSIGTSIHELAHAVIHNKDSGNRHLDSPTKEFQAELTSYIVSKHYGMDTSEKAIPYIANWTKNGQKIQDKEIAIEGVHKTVKHFIHVIDPVIAKEKELEQQMEVERESDQVYAINENFLRKMGLEQENFNKGLVQGSYGEVERKPYLEQFAEHNKEGYHRYLTFEALYNQQIECDEVNFNEPMLYIHGEPKGFKPFGELNDKELSSLHSTVRYTVALPGEDGKITAFSGSYAREEYLNPLHQIRVESLTDSATYEQLDKSYNSYLIEKEQKEMESFTSRFKGNRATADLAREPEVASIKDSQEKQKDVYYYYDREGKPFELGDIQEIREGYSSGNNEITSRITSNDLKALEESKHDDKETFNLCMDRHHIYKNPTVQDFQKINESWGISKNTNLGDMVDEGKNTSKRSVAFLNRAAMERE